MKVSTKGRYALRFLINIASRTDGKPVSIKDVAAQEEISEKYLEQITSVLNSGGLVKSTRGPQGGYLLRKAPEDITVGMVLRLDKAIRDVVDTTTIADLVAERPEAADNYCI